MVATDTIAEKLSWSLLSGSTEAGEMSHSLSIVIANWAHNNQQGSGSKRKENACTHQGNPEGFINVANNTLLDA